MIMSHLGHTTRFIQSFRITETFEASSVFNMPTDKLLYDDRHWQEILEKDIRKISLERKLHLIFTLVMFLQISVVQLLHFIFTSDIKEVWGRAARFLGYTPTATSKEMEFPPGMVFGAWHNNFPKARAQLHKMIQPCAIEMVLDESDKLIGGTLAENLPHPTRQCNVPHQQ